MSKNRRHFTEVEMANYVSNNSVNGLANYIYHFGVYGNLGLNCSEDEFSKAVALYLEVNLDDFKQAAQFWIDEWRKPLKLSDTIELIVGQDEF